MRTISYDNTFGMVDLAVYTELMAQDNKDQINRLKREEAVAPSEPPVPSAEETLLTEIRDLLKAQQNKS